AIADHDDARLRRRPCVVGAGGKRGGKDNGEDRGGAQRSTPSGSRRNFIGEMRLVHNRSPFIARVREQTYTLIAKRRQNCGGSPKGIRRGKQRPLFVRNGT